jgi:hypothetical protein
MEERMYLIDLYDYYQGLLTDKQRDYFELYYFDNLTMDEIAEEQSVSKNAVSKSLMEVKDKLEEYESILKLNENRNKIRKILSDEEYDKINELI